MKHKHHIIPKYRGGSDSSHNIVELTPCQHAMFHFANWQLWSDHRDYCAYKMLLGDVKSPEFKSAQCKAFQGKIQSGARKWRENNIEKVKEHSKNNNRIQRERLSEQGKTIAEKHWVLTFEDGKQERVTNLAKWCKDNNYSKCHLSTVSKGKRSKHKDIVAVVKC